LWREQIFLDANSRRFFVTQSSRALFFALAAVVAAGALSPVRAQDYNARAAKIVDRMTLQEKIQELHGVQDKDHRRYVPGVPRLHIPDLRVTNGPAGAGPGDQTPQLPATALPAPIALAATWDPKAAYEYGVIVGREARYLANGLMEGPDINIARVPQNGRTFEAFGEDPYLVSRMAVGEIEGIQSQHVIADVKHYVANNQEADRFRVNEVIGQRALHEIYFPAFKASIEEAHSAALMCAYPKVNGIFNCENDYLMNQVLKKDWDFAGFITSDFGATHSTELSALAGLDLEMPGGKYFAAPLEAAAKSRKVPMSVIDEKLVRRFRTMMALGVWEHPPRLHPIPQKADGLAARRLAEEGMVLLKNEGGLLPLDAASLHSIAVIGPYAAKAMTGGGGSSHVVPLYTVAPVEGIEHRAGPGVKVTFSDGSDRAQAASLAKSADVAIVMVGDRETEGRDHPIALEGNQDSLVEAVAAANPKTVVVLKSGSTELMPWAERVPAILEAWYPGEEDGNAVAAVLFGDVDPSGKLPLTFPKKLADLPASTAEQYPGVDGVVHYSEGIFVGYRYYDEKGIEPLFPFGYGLSYTTFAFKNLKISPATASGDPSSSVTVDFDVTNTGHRAGAEVAQLYLGIPSSAAVPQPPKQLKGFDRVELRPGQTGHVSLTLDSGSISYWNVEKRDWAVMPGTYQVMVGSSSREIALSGSFSVR
jgi:beta-glucosidase